MTKRIDYFDYQKGDEASRAAYDARSAADGGYVTNMKKTLLRSLPAFKALMEWYPLRDECLKFLDRKAIAVFCHSISTENECLICSMFFVREFSDLGVDLKTYQFTPQENLLAQFGRKLVKEPNKIDDALFGELLKLYSQDQIVVLTAFGGLMIATNLINNALNIELDEGLRVFTGGK
jgi:alkylhydroperoxidase family enzyme